MTGSWSQTFCVWNVFWVKNCEMFSCVSRCLKVLKYKSKGLKTLIGKDAHLTINTQTISQCLSAANVFHFTCYLNYKSLLSFLLHVLESRYFTSYLNLSIHNHQKSPLSYMGGQTCCNLRADISDCSSCKSHSGRMITFPEDDKEFSTCFWSRPYLPFHHLQMNKTPWI